VGGIERALIALLHNINYEEYDVTLLLERKEGVFLNEIPSKVKIIEYKISACKFVPIRKIINRLKLIKTILRHKNKYDFACCYAPYSIPGAILSKAFSKNNAIWIHSNYYYLYNKDTDRIKHFFDERGINEFGHIIFVAEEAMNHFIKLYPNLKDKALVCNNLVNVDYITKMANAPIEEVKPSKPLFINICRHDEPAKKLTRLIEASDMLKQANYDFEVWLIGNGPDTEVYLDLIDDLDISDKVKIIGFRKNPYPYYKLADAFVLTSNYEGFPVVYLESVIFNVPIITTIDVSGDGLKIKDNYGVIAEKNSADIFAKMKDFIDKGYDIKIPFDAFRYNNRIKNKMEDMFNNIW
jgi:uncharacterized protein YlbG (UPF0298 family)